MRRTRARWFLPSLVTLLAACAGCGAMNGFDPAGLPPEMGEVPDRPAAVGDPETANNDLAEYRIFPHDTLEIQVYGHNDLSRRLQVSSDGRISFPLVGVLAVGGMSAPEAESRLEEALAEYLVNPQVTVIAPQVRERITRREEEVFVFVSGQVRNPGAYRFKPGMTAYQALTLAGWLTSIAAPNRTRVIRRTGEGEEVFVVPVADIQRRGDMTRDVALEPNDVIVVPESFF